VALTDRVRDNTAVVAQQVLAATVFERQYNFARFPTFDASLQKQQTYLNSWPAAVISSLAV